MQSRSKHDFATVFFCSFSIKNQYFWEKLFLRIELYYRCLSSSNNIVLDYEIYDVRSKNKKNKKAIFFDTQ